MDDEPRDSNDNAITYTETRTGPPLDYDGEKLQHAIDSLAWTINRIREYFPDDLRFPTPPHPTGFPTVRVDVLGDLKVAFTNQLVAYLALHNMLALANDHSLEERLLGMQRDDLREWLERIYLEGEVSDRRERLRRKSGNGPIGS